VRLLLPETLHQLRLFSRRPAAMFFVIAMPLVLLLVFTQVFGNEPIPGMGITTAQFYTPSLAVFGVVMACYTYLAISTAAARDQGVLKRVRGTPLPPGTYIAARILSASLIALVAAGLVMIAGAIGFGVVLIPDRLPAAATVMVTGALCFSALGMLVTAVCRSSETVQAVTSATILPLAFVSDVFIRPGDALPEWIRRVADAFPLRHFSQGFGKAFDYAVSGTGWTWQGSEEVYAVPPHLAVMAVWGVMAAIGAALLFRWDSH
jgi:ABC-2 type transport system permease protein